MLRRENDNSFIKNLHFWLVHLVGDCSNFILCDVLYLSSEKISFLSQTSVKISRKAFYQVVNNDENSSYGTVQYSFCQQKKCLELFWQDMETSLLSCFCRFLKLEWRIKISLKQRLYIISSDFNYLSVRFLHSSRSKLKCSSHLCGQTKELSCFLLVVFFPNGMMHIFLPGVFFSLGSPYKSPRSAFRGFLVILLYLVWFSFFVLKSPPGIARQWNSKKITILPQKPWSQIRVSTYRTWAINMRGP